jgi:hypothetical protein
MDQGMMNAGSPAPHGRGINRLGRPLDGSALRRRFKRAAAASGLRGSHVGEGLSQLAVPSKNYRAKTTCLVMASMRTDSNRRAQSKFPSLLALWDRDRGRIRRDTTACFTVIFPRKRLVGGLLSIITSAPPVGVAAVADGDDQDEMLVLVDLVDDSVRTPPGRKPTPVLKHQRFPEPALVISDGIEGLEDRGGDRDR